MVIANLTCEKYIGAFGHGAVGQEIACATTNGNTLHEGVRTSIVHEAIHVENFLDARQKVQCAFRLGQCADDAASALAIGSRFKELHIAQAKHFSDTIVDAAQSIVQIGVGSIQGHPAEDSLAHAPLHKRIISDALQSAKEQRMMADDHIAAHCHCLANHFGGNVQTQ